ncbi:MAG: alpha/beta fold hydrolase [Anaerolineales bacterium]|nr:alpha/beta fold hydrolase [Anaerolineales bacterium]
MPSQITRKPANLLGAAAALLGTAVTAAPAAWILYSKLAIDHNVPLPEAVPATRQQFHSQTAGTVSYYVANAAAAERPLLLIHSVNAAASAYEMRPLFEHFRGSRPVYAIDLPGFGFSERKPARVAPQVFEDAIVDLVAREIGRPVDAVALSLGGEFLARAALANPRWFHSIAIISPTGFNAQGEGRPTQRANASNTSSLFYNLFSFPLWARPLFDLIASRRGLRFFLEKSFVGPVPQGLIDYDYATAHQPHAEYVPLHFISGLLFTRNVRHIVYENVHVPALAIYDEDFYSNFDTLPELAAAKANWHAVRLQPTRGLPQFEKLPELANILETFWQQTPDAGA